MKKYFLEHPEVAQEIEAAIRQNAAEAEKSLMPKKPAAPADAPAPASAPSAAPAQPAPAVMDIDIEVED